LPHQGIFDYYSYPRIKARCVNMHIMDCRKKIINMDSLKKAIRSNTGKRNCCEYFEDTFI
jgi:hypothetical protein